MAKRHEPPQVGSAPAAAGRPTYRDVVRLIERLEPPELDRLIEYQCAQAVSVVPYDRHDFVSEGIGPTVVKKVRKSIRFLQFEDNNCATLVCEIQSRSLHRPDTIAGAEREALEAKLGRPPDPELLNEVIRLRNQEPKGWSYARISKHLNSQGHDTTRESVRKLYNRAPDWLKKRT
jgi:hypothetical protein